jgi:hypothetical protein
MLLFPLFLPSSWLKDKEFSKIGTFKPFYGNNTGKYNKKMVFSHFYSLFGNYFSRIIVYIDKKVKMEKGNK